MLINLFHVALLGLLFLYTLRGSRCAATRRLSLVPLAMCGMEIFLAGVLDTRFRFWVSCWYWPVRRWRCAASWRCGVTPPLPVPRATNAPGPRAPNCAHSNRGA